MKKNKIWKVLAVISSWGAVFVTGMVISGNTAESLQLFIIIAFLVAIISVGNYYTIDDMTDEEFDEYFRALMKKRYFEDRWQAARKAVKARKNLKNGKRGTKNEIRCY